MIPKGQEKPGAWEPPPPIVAPVTDVVSNRNIDRALGQAAKEKNVDDRVKELHETEAEEASISHAVKIKKANQPYEPTAAERAAHEMTCIPYRSWCKYCVAGKAADSPHKQQAKGDKEHIPVIEFDYNFIGAQTESEKKVTMLVAIDSVHSSITAPTVRKKGSGDEYAMQALLNYVKQLGFRRPNSSATRSQAPSTS